jgi:hypothetical protein
MMYYVLHFDKGEFVIHPTAEKVATYLLGKSVNHVIIFKAIPEFVGAKIYIPSDGDVTKIQEELEALL